MKKCECTFTYKFSIGQRVYQAIPDGEIGIITDIWFSIAQNLVIYQTVFGIIEMDCKEFMITDEKMYN